MNKDKQNFVLLILVFSFLIFGLGMWFWNSGRLGHETARFDVSAPLLILLLLALALPRIVRHYKSLQQGEVVEDERSRLAYYKAGTFSFMASLYLLLAMGILFEDKFDSPSDATGLAIIGMSIIFFLSWIYYQKK